MMSPAQDGGMSRIFWFHFYNVMGRSGDMSFIFIYVDGSTRSNHLQTWTFTCQLVLLNLQATRDVRKQEIIEYLSF